MNSTCIAGDTLMEATAAREAIHTPSHSQWVGLNWGTISNIVTMNPTKTDDTYSFTSVHMHGCFGLLKVHISICSFPNSTTWCYWRVNIPKASKRTDVCIINDCPWIILPWEVQVVWVKQVLSELAPTLSVNTQSGQNQVSFPRNISKVLHLSSKGKRFDSVSIHPFVLVLLSNKFHLYVKVMKHQQ